MIVPLFTKLDRMLTLFVFVLFQVMCRCTCGHVTFSGGIRNLIVFGDISFKIQCTRLVLIGYKNVTGDIQKYVKIIMKNGFCNVKFCFGIALSKTGRPSSTHDNHFEIFLLTIFFVLIDHLSSSQCFSTDMVYYIYLLLNFTVPKQCTYNKNN